MWCASEAAADPCPGKRDRAIGRLEPTSRAQASYGNILNTTEGFPRRLVFVLLPESRVAMILSAVQVLYKNDSLVNLIDLHRCTPFNLFSLSISPRPKCPRLATGVISSEISKIHYGPKSGTR